LPTSGAGGPGASADSFTGREDVADDGLPGADDRFFEPEDLFGTGSPGEDRSLDAAPCGAAMPLEPPAPTSAAVASMASDRDVFLIGVLLVLDGRKPVRH
jgi:hypothetical protein